ncbi:hypothetical protein AA0116_g8471 [Alternaria tenuissima]|nr:hypothetical protein AA0116_g8471 [Alternaria tenuissima]
MPFVTNARAATAAVKLQTRAISAASQAQAKSQPWRAFWPPRAEQFSEAEKKKMPWLTWKYDPTKPTDRPWREWMLENQKTVARRGGL